MHKRTGVDQRAQEKSQFGRIIFICFIYQIILLLYSEFLFPCTQMIRVIS